MEGSTAPRCQPEWPEDQLAPAGESGESKTPGRPRSASSVSRWAMASSSDGSLLPAAQTRAGGRQQPASCRCPPPARPSAAGGSHDVPLRDGRSPACQRSSSRQACCPSSACALDAAAFAPSGPVKISRPGADCAARQPSPVTVRRHRREAFDEDTWSEPRSGLSSPRSSSRRAGLGRRRPRGDHCRSPDLVQPRPALGPAVVSGAAFAGPSAWSAGQGSMVASTPAGRRRVVEIKCRR